MGTKYYKNIASLKEIDEIIEIAEKAIGTSSPVITKDSAGIPLAVVASLASVSGVGAAIAAGGIGVAGTGAGLAVGIGGVGAGVLLAPVAIPAAIITGLVYLVFKSKKDRELNEKIKMRLKKAIKKQNQVIEKLEAIIKELTDTARKAIHDNEKLSQKSDELMAINEALKGVINKMTDQLT